MRSEKITVRSTARTLSAWLLAALVGLAAAGCDTPQSLQRDANRLLAKGDRAGAALQLKALLAREPRHAEAHFQLGKIFAEINMLPAAEDMLRRAMEFGKPAADVVPVLGGVLLDQEKYKEVLELVEAGPKRAAPTDPKLLAEQAVLRGMAYLGLRDLTGANTQFQLALHAAPEKAKLGLAQLATAKNEQPRAELLLREVLALNAGNADAHLALGELLRNAGEVDKALAEYAEAVKLQPYNVNMLSLYVIALVNADRVGPARPLLEKAKKLAPAGPLVHFAQAMIECKDRLYKQCSETLERVFDMLPTYLPAILLAGQANFALGNFEQGQDAFIRYLQRFPADPHARKMLAATLLAKMQAQEAMNVLRPLLATRPDDPQLLGIAGQALLQLGHPREARGVLIKAVKLAPDNPEFRSALAMTNLANGLRRQAEADFRAAIALKPENTKPDYGLIMLLLAENRVEPAREIATAVEQRLPNKPDTYMLKGIVLRAANDARGARGAFQKAGQLDANYFPAVQELADLDVAEGKEDAARTRLQQVLRKNPGHVDALLALARLEFRGGRRADGLSWARQAADANPESANALLMVAEAQADGGELTEAMASARGALKLRPRDPRALKLLGQLQTAAKDPAAAVTTYTTLASVRPGSMEANTLLATAHLAAGDFRTALAVARNALKRNPASLEAKALVGDVLMQGKKYAEAIEFAQQVQRENPKSSLGYRIEGEAYFAQADYKRALKAFETAAKLDPSGAMLAKVHHAQSLAAPGTEREAALEEWVRQNPEDTETRVYLADALGTKGRQKDAIAHYEEIVRIDPKDPRVLNNLAWALNGINDPRALIYAERAYQLRPNESSVLDTYGWILVSRNRVHEGIQMLLRAVALDANNPEIRFHLAKALAQTGDKMRARNELRAVLRTGKPFPQAEEARALLTSLGS